MRYLAALILAILTATAVGGRAHAPDAAVDPDWVFVEAAEPEPEPPPQPVRLAAPPEPRIDRVRYRASLRDCIRGRSSCDPSELSKSDRRYLRYELGDQVLDAETADAIVEMRTSGAISLIWYGDAGPGPFRGDPVD